MDELLKVLLGVALAIIAYLFREKMRASNLERENALLKTDKETKESVVQYEESKKDATDSQSLYDRARDEFRKLYGKSGSDT